MRQHEAVEEVQAARAIEYLASLRAVADDVADDAVYFLATEDGSLVKIGFSAARIDSRVAELRRMNAYPLSLLAVFTASMEVEKALHILWADHRLHSEWFALTGEMRAFVAECRTLTPAGIVAAVQRRLRDAGNGRAATALGIVEDEQHLRAWCSTDETTEPGLGESWYLARRELTRGAAA